MFYLCYTYTPLNPLDFYFISNLILLTSLVDVNDLQQTFFLTSGAYVTKLSSFAKYPSIKSNKRESSELV